MISEAAAVFGPKFWVRLYVEHPLILVPSGIRCGGGVVIDGLESGSDFKVRLGDVTSMVIVGEVMTVMFPG